MRTIEGAPTGFQAAFQNFMIKVGTPQLSTPTRATRLQGVIVLTPEEMYAMGGRDPAKVGGSDNDSQA